MAELIIPAPSEKQRLFLMDRHKYVGFGGARGGGICPSSAAKNCRHLRICANERRV